MDQQPESRLSPRIGQAMESVNIDALHPDRGPVLSSIELDKLAKTGVVKSEFIEKLWNDPKNADVVRAFMDNPMCQFWAHGSDDQILPTYQNYAIQDYFYLIDYVKFKALRLTTIPVSDFNTLSEEATSTGKSWTYAAEWADTCVNMLGISPSRLQQTDRSVAELAYANYLQNNSLINDWFKLHVIMIACVYGWGELANQLNADPKTNKNNIFYKTWIEPNLDSSSAIKLAKFLDVNRDLWASQRDMASTWGSLFRTGLRLEVALFNSSTEFMSRR
jgi:thiaminase